MSSDVNLSRGSASWFSCHCWCHPVEEEPRISMSVEDLSATTKRFFSEVELSSSQRGSTTTNACCVRSGSEKGWFGAA